MSPFLSAYEDLLSRLYGSAHEVLAAVPERALDWSPGASSNSIATLILHLTGAQRFLIGDIVGGQESGRDRAAEFAQLGWTAERLRQRLDETLAHSRGVLAGMSAADLESMRRTPSGREVSVAWALGHALEHTAMHVGHLQVTADWWQREHRSRGKEQDG